MGNHKSFLDVIQNPNSSLFDEQSKTQVNKERSKADFDKEIKYLDDIFRSDSNLGSLEAGLTDALYGIDNSQTKINLPKSQEKQGYVFFTRPQLNLTKPNIRREITMYDLLNKNPNSMGAYIRNILDPRLARSGESKHNLVNSLNPFIPLLSNTIESKSGAQDIVAQTYTSEPGLRKEQWSMVDGPIDLYGVTDIDLTFRRIEKDPTLMLFYTWLKYMANVYENKQEPYMDKLIQNEIDYMTRIYRIVTEVDGTTISRISCNGASFPISLPIGQFDDFNINSPRFNQNETMTIRFKSIGQCYMNPIIMDEFNETLAIFNRDFRFMKENLYSKTKKPHNLQKVPQDLLLEFRHKALPFINTREGKLEWYVPNEVAELYLKNKGH